MVSKEEWKEYFSNSITNLEALRENKYVKKSI